MSRHLALGLAVTAVALASSEAAAQARPATPATAAQPAHAAHTAATAHVTVNASELTWGNGPASLPPGARAIAIEGNPAEAGPFTLRLLLPDDYQIAPHSHPGIEHVTVLSGSFFIGTGTTPEFKQMKELRAGGFMVMPPNTVHYARARGETVLQLHGIGPWAVNYVNPADDPRRK